MVVAFTRPRHPQHERVLRPRLPGRLQLLPSSVASTVMATSPMVMMLLAWGLVSERPAVTHLLGAAVGVAGVALTVFTGAEAVERLGRRSRRCPRWSCRRSASSWPSAGARGVDVLASTAWQLTAGGLVLVPIAIIAEGAPPVVDAPAIGAYAYVSVIATAVAFTAWFTGLRHLPAGTVGLIGLLNPRDRRAGRHRGRRRDPDPDPAGRPGADVRGHPAWAARVSSRRGADRPDLRPRHPDSSPPPGTRRPAGSARR